MSDFVPRASTTSALALLQADKAYRIARWHASHGVPPNLAARHGAAASGRLLFSWFFVLPPAFLLAAVYWTNSLGWLAWKGFVLYLSLVIWRRGKVFAATDPRYRLCYVIRTNVYVVAWFLAWILGLVAAMLP